MGRSFHRPGTVKENVLESDFEPLCDGTTRRRSLADLRLLEGSRIMFKHAHNQITVTFYGLQNYTLFKK